MPKTVCMKCQKSLKNIKSGVVVAEMSGNPPHPYKLWNADIYSCPDCDFQVVAGFADQPFAEHWQDDFADKLKEAGDVIEWHERTSDGRENR